MIKKLVKYGKILMALTLIGALSIPSYATVGASDGSAFVTKAEFDAALSDFNARLTTFEAGINSKIDSQVSSYLDRNGIWNGKEQTITMSATSVPTGIKEDAWPSTFRSGTVYDLCLGRIRVIEKVNKSGLCVLKRSWGSTNKYPRIERHSQGRSSQSHYDDAQYYNVFESWYAGAYGADVWKTATFAESDLKGMSAVGAPMKWMDLKAGGSTSVDTDFGHHLGTYLPQKATNMFYFFVSKDDAVVEEWRLYWYDFHQSVPVTIFLGNMKLKCEATVY